MLHILFFLTLARGHAAFLSLTSRSAFRHLPAKVVSMELRMPEDVTTIERLIQRQKDNLAESMILVLHFEDPSADASSVSPWDVPTYDTSFSSASPSRSAVMHVAATYKESERFGGRPLLVLQVDRDVVGMASVCAQRGIYRFPTIEVWSRGSCQTVSAGDLESTLLKLGVASQTRPPKEGSSFGGVGTGPRARAAARPADLFGVRDGGAQLSRQAIDKAMAQVPQRAAGGGLGRQQGATEDVEAPPPFAVIEMEADATRDGANVADASADAQLNAKLDAIFAPSTFDDDDDDMLPPV